MNNHMIWASTSQNQQTYAVFRKTFLSMQMPTSAIIDIFADNRYLLWINGCYVERGPCRFDPRMPAYDTLDIVNYLHEGQNSIVVLVHYFAVKSMSIGDQCARMMDNGPGFAAQLRLISSGKNEQITTDSTWRVSTKTRFQNSPGTYTSICDNIDARLDLGEWEKPEFDDSGWNFAIPIDGSKWGQLRPRPIPLLRQEVLTPNVVSQSKSPKPYLPLEISQHNQIVLDVDKVVQGFCILDFEAESGTELDVHFRVISDKNEAEGEKHCRYIAKDGPQTYMSTDTFGFKYIVLTILTGHLKLTKATVVDRRYPFKRLGSFASNDDVLNKIWNICLNTIEVCTEDAYTDCADRERAQWLGDSVMLEYPMTLATQETVSQFCEPPLNDQRLLKKVLSDVALSQLPDGRLQPMRPSEYPEGNRHGVIEDFSCYWVHGIKEVYDNTGDKEFVITMMPTLLKLTEHFLKSQTSRGLSNLEEFCIFSNPLAYKVCEGATVNAAIYDALKKASYLCRIIGDEQNSHRFVHESEKLKLAYNEYLWDEKAKSYYGSIVNGCSTPATGHAAMIALYYGLVPQERYKSVFDFMMQQLPGENLFTFGYLFFFKVLYDQNNKYYDELVLETIRDKWSHMLNYETGTVSEGFHGGSPVHNFGAVPAFFFK